MKNSCFLILIFLLVSCGDKLIKEPENLISKDKMTNILYDLSILYSTKKNDAEFLKKNNIKLMEYLFTKYSIDSLQFVESNTYYAAIPLEYEEIYTNLEMRLVEKKEAFELAKKIADSLMRIKKINEKKDLNNMTDVPERK